MAHHDLVVSFLSSVPGSVLSSFQRKPLTISSPVTQFPTGKWPGGSKGYAHWLAQYADSKGRVIPGLAKAAGAKPGDTIGRVCVMGFSNGCVGVDHVLRATDSALIDTVLAVDGIHGSYAAPGQLRPSSYKRYLNRAMQCAKNNPETDFDAAVTVITHSVIRPGSYPSTTETADYIWKTVMGKAKAYNPLMLNCGYPCDPVVHVADIQSAYSSAIKICNRGKCSSWKNIDDGWYDKRVANNFFVLGWGDSVGGKLKTRDPRGYNDHIFQGRVVLKALLQEFCVKRWKHVCAPVAVVGLGQGDVVCTLERGQIYSESDAAKVDYFPEIPDVGGPPVPAPSCPAPPPGRVIVATAEDPCATAVDPRLGRPAQPTASPSVWPYLAGAAGLAVGFGATRWIRSHLK